MRASAFLLLLSTIAVGCGDDSRTDSDRDGSTEQRPDGGDGDGDADGDGGDGDGDGDADGGDGDGDGDRQDIVSAMIGTEGGTITSSDGKLTLTIPEGALEDDELISIELLPKGEARSLLVDANELVSYRFEPDGLEFAEPVGLELELDELITPEDDEAVVPLVFASVYSDSENTLQYLEQQDLQVDLDSGDGTFTSEIEHFSTYSFETWPTDNEVTTYHFYFELSPYPPPEMELGKDYDVGLTFHTLRLLNEPLPLIYEDSSEGLVYSEGSGPIEIGSIPGEEDQPTSFVVDVGDYACSELGSALYQASIDSDMFRPPPSGECETATEETKCLVPNPPLPVRYNVQLSRRVECIPEDTTNPTPDGAPFRGYVQHKRSLGDGSGRELSGAFYDGGADQAAFDEYVTVQRRKLGIMPDRGADGTCRPVALELYDSDIDFPGSNFDFAHVGAGADDAIGIDFLLGDPPFTASYQDLVGTYRGTFAYNMAFTAEGLAIHVPASASEPTIVLPAWDEDIGYPPNVTPGNLLLPWETGADLSVTWQAEQVGGELVHIWGYASDGTVNGAAFECFASIETQLVTVPAAIITGPNPGEPTDPHFVSITFQAGSMTSVVDNGRTLDGYNVFNYTLSEQTDTNLND